MRYEFKLPDLAEGMVEGELVDWLCAPGDAVNQEQPIAEVMTDKATVMISSPVKGQILELPWEPGDIIPVGETLVVFNAESEIPEQREHAGHVMPDKVAAPAASEPTVPQPPQQAQQAAPQPAAAQPAPVAASVPAVGRGTKALASPATRRMARELGVDIGEVRGSGPAGRVTAEDVQRALQPAPVAATAAPIQATPPVVAPVAPLVFEEKVAEEVEERVKIRGLRRAIFEAMTRSTQTAAHFTYVDEVDCEALIEARNQLKHVAEAKGVKLTYLAFIAKAILAALPRFPKLNAEIDDANREAVLKKHVHLGIAAATDPGLVVPVIRHAHMMSILELAAQIQGLGERARQNTLRPDELKGSTITITSLGRLGGLFATPVINHPEVAIVGVHQISRRAVVMDDGSIVARHRMNISLSFDHRLIDGHEGAAFAQAVKEYLENPHLLLLELV